jgi:hypothetical protein
MLVLSKVFRSLHVSGYCVVPPSFLSQRLFASTESSGSAAADDPIILAEDLPPIPPNYGYVGDVNVQAIHEIN